MLPAMENGPKIGGLSLIFGRNCCNEKPVPATKRGLAILAMSDARMCITYTPVWTSSARIAS